MMEAILLFHLDINGERLVHVDMGGQFGAEAKLFNREYVRIPFWRGMQPRCPLVPPFFFSFNAIPGVL